MELTIGTIYKGTDGSTYQLTHLPDNKGVCQVLELKTNYLCLIRSEHLKQA
jgi:hypothetical protein